MFQDLFFRCCVYPVNLRELHPCWEGGREGGSFWLGFVQEELCVVSQDCPGSGTLLSPIWAGMFGRAALGGFYCYG